MPITINGSNTPTAGGVGYGDGTNVAFGPAGTSGQVLTSAGASAPSWISQRGLSVGTATNVAGGAAGNVHYQSGAGATAFVTNGTAGQVLTSNGSSAPTWATPSTGAMALISSQIASNSSAISWTGLSGYTNYLLVLQSIMPTTNNTTVQVQLGTGATPTYITSGYQSQQWAVNSAGTANFSGIYATGFCINYNDLKDVTTVSDVKGLSGTISILGMGNGVNTMYSGTMTYNSSVSTPTIMRNGFCGGSSYNTTTKTAIMVNMSSGNISSGILTLYGLV